MKAAWQKARLEVNTRARTLVQEIRSIVFKNSIYKGLMEETSAIASLDPEDTPPLQVFTDLAFAKLPEELREALGVKLVHGLIHLTRHGWFVIEGNFDEVNADPAAAQSLANCMHYADIGSLVWRVIVDVHAVDIEPTTLMVVPTAPIYPFYVEQARFDDPIDYTAQLEAAKGEATEESQFGLICKAFLNKKGPQG